MTTSNDTSSPEILLRVVDLDQRFGGLHALQAISFDVVANEILGVIGPNGAGKSTLFNTMIGLTPARSGHVWLDGTDLTRLSVAKVISSGVVKTSQTVQVFSEMTVLDNVAVAALHQGYSLKEARGAAAEELAFWGLSESAEKSAQSLTLAQRSTLELARALTLKPTVLLVDEVMAGLNESEVDLMLDRLIRANAERGVTLLIIEHNMRALMKVAHRILCVDYGERIALGPPEDVSIDPRVIQAYLGTS